ncbi:hypothetical protein QYF36_012123 [Acer negundo]|nr:hypothetical protein QYF36_012123 [Acer negundo]
MEVQSGDQIVMETMGLAEGNQAERTDPGVLADVTVNYIRASVLKDNESDHEILVDKKRRPVEDKMVPLDNGKKQKMTNGMDSRSSVGSKSRDSSPAFHSQ